MDVMVVGDGHYYKGIDGRIYVESVFDYDFYKRYLQIFDKVYVVARVSNMQPPEGKKVASGENVEFLELPSFRGPWQYVFNFRLINRLVKTYVEMCGVAIFRIPGATANIMCKKYSKTEKPFAIEVIADPWESFSKGTIVSITRPIIRVLWTKFVARMCLQANGVAYVTKEYLQKKYPSNKMLNPGDDNYFDTYYSSVELKDDSFGKPKKYVGKKHFVISHVANTFASYGKGHTILMKALKLVRERGYEVNVVFIGDGPLMQKFKKLSRELAIDKYVCFLGRLPNGDVVRDELEKTDLFVFPTVSEGMPRVLLEAMSVGLPCISSPVGGITEIINKEYLIRYDDYDGYANKIISLISDPEVMENLSRYNISVARNYSNSILSERRRIFYGKLRRIAEKNFIESREDQL